MHERQVARAGHDLSRRDRVAPAPRPRRRVTIKSHHNVGGLPETLHLKLLEPLRELFKDEVRELGLALGLPREMVYRHPFPGPGLGVRILGEVKREYADLLRRADAIFIEELRAKLTGWYDKTAQAFAVFLPVRSVGVMGDGRTYEYVVALRAVQTTDFMTARLGGAAARAARAAFPTASSTRCAASTASSTTSPPSRRRPSSGSSLRALAGGAPASTSTVRRNYTLRRRPRTVSLTWSSSCPQGRSSCRWSCRSPCCRCWSPRYPRCPARSSSSATWASWCCRWRRRRPIC